MSEDQRNSISFILAGYQEDMSEQIYEWNRGFSNRFVEIKCTDMSSSQLEAVWLGILKEKCWTQSSPQVGKAVVNRLSVRSGKRGFGNAREVRQQFERACSCALDNPTRNQAMIDLVDVLGPSPSPSTNKSLQSALQELNSKIGWQSIKDEVSLVVSFVEENHRRSMEGHVVEQLNFNCVFLGNPGTGKSHGTEKGKK